MGNFRCLMEEDINISMGGIENDSGFLSTCIYGDFPLADDNSIFPKHGLFLNQETKAKYTSVNRDKSLFEES